MKRRDFRFLPEGHMAVKLAQSVALLCVVCFADFAPAEDSGPTYGPAKGTLVIVGGGNAEGTGIMERFIQLGGGAEDGKFVIVPTAGGNKNRDGSIKAYNEEQVVAGWKRRGVKNVKMLHTADPKVADTEDFVK